MDKENINKVENYIRENWKNCVRTNYEDAGCLLGLPFPYTVPCVKGEFQELYYWDTYFINIGLIKSGLFEKAKNNVDNFLYEVKKYGFIPNSSATFHLNRSQAPFLSMMVRDIYEKYEDVEWLRNTYETLKHEYRFWMDKRITPIGLNRYFHHASNNGDIIDFFNYISKSRINLKAETFNPRFEGHCADFVPVDLNSNLYLYEKNFEYFSEILKTGEFLES